MGTSYSHFLSLILRMTHHWGRRCLAQLASKQNGVFAKALRRQSKKLVPVRTSEASRDSGAQGPDLKNDAGYQDKMYGKLIGVCDMLATLLDGAILTDIMQRDWNDQ